MSFSAAFKHPGVVLLLAAPYDRSGGQGALIGAVFGVAGEDVLSTVEAPFHTEGVYELTKVGSQAWSRGDKIYWDDGNKRLTTVATAGPFVGVATEAAGAGAGVVLGTIKLCPPQVLLEGPQTGEANTVAAAAATAGGSTPTAAQVDTGIATAIAPLVVTINSLITKLELAGVLATV